MSEIFDMVNWIKTNHLNMDQSKGEIKYVTLMTETDPFYECKHGYFFDIPEHHVHLSQCDITHSACNSHNCPNFEHK